MSKKKYLIGGIALVLLTAAAFLSNYETGQQADSAPGAGKQDPAQLAEMPEAGYRAPLFDLPLLAGEGTVSLAKLQGKPVLLNFWASWCGPCKMEMPDLQAEYERYKDKVQFYLVNLTSQDDEEDAAAFLKEFGITIPTLKDMTGSAFQAYRLASIPSTFAIGPDGVIAEKRIGALTKPQMDGMLQRLVREQ